jgi:class 3 adenylate cyclase
MAPRPPRALTSPDVDEPRAVPSGPDASQQRTEHTRRAHRPVVIIAWIVASSLPLIGLVSLFLRRQLDPRWDTPRVHFAVFMTVGWAAIVLSHLAGDAAERRGDARVYLLSLAFLVTGGFLAVHALGSPGVLLTSDVPGFAMAIPVGMMLGALFACASALVGVRPRMAARVVRRRTALRRSVYLAIALWSAWTVAELPPLAGTSVEGAAPGLGILALLGCLVYLLSALLYVLQYRGKFTLLPTSIVACFVLVGEALFGSALVGERTWHASWWEWHALIVTAYVLVLYAARSQWREERFRHLYLPTTRDRTQEVSVLFADLAGFTTFTEQSPPSEVTAMLGSYYGMATPLISEQFGGDVEKFIGDAIMATFNTRGDQPDHASRAAGAALELQRQMRRLNDEHPRWPRLRVGVNTGEARVRELGGPGYLVYAVVGDMVNLASRLQTNAPVGGVLIGAATYRRLAPLADVETRAPLVVKGKRAPVDAYVLNALPAGQARKERLATRAQ